MWGSGETGRVEIVLADGQKQKIKRTLCCSITLYMLGGIKIRYVH